MYQTKDYAITVNIIRVNDMVTMYGLSTNRCRFATTCESRLISCLGVGEVNKRHVPIEYICQCIVKRYKRTTLNPAQLHLTVGESERGCLRAQGGSAMGG